MNERKNSLIWRAVALAGAFLLVSLSVAPANAQVWEKKPWQQWSKDDCKKIQEDSPWAGKWYRTHVAEDRFGRPTGGDTRETEQHIFYVIQLRSALPIRQAFIREAQINNKYDKMSGDQKKNFDASAEAFLNRQYNDVIIVHVLYGTNIQNDERELMRFWQTNYPSGTVPMEAFLTTSTGKRVPPIRYVSGTGGILEFELIYPRLVNGEPLITPDVKSIGVEFQHPNIGPEGTARVYQEFKTQKMMLKGELVF